MIKTKQDNIMKKLYILLTAFFAAVSGLNAANIVMTDMQKYSWVYAWDGNIGAARHYQMTQLGDKVKFFYSSASFDKCIFEENNGFDGQTGDLNPNQYPKDFNSDENFMTWSDNTWKPFKIGVRGSWTGDNDNWYNIYFTKVDGSRYATSTITFPDNGGEVKFGFLVTDNEDAQKSWAGYGGHRFNMDDTKARYNTGDNSYVELYPGMKYHFEFDFITLELTLVVEPVSVPKKLYLVYSNGEYWNGYNNFIEVTPNSQNEFVWTKKFNEGDYFVISENFGSSWENLADGMYGTEVNKNDFDKFWITWANLNVPLNLIKRDSKPYFFQNTGHKSGYYRITVSFENKYNPQLKVEYFEDMPEDSDIKVEVIVHNYDKYGNEVTPQRGMYSIVTLKSNKPNAYIYYTLDDTDPTEASTCYSKPFMVVKNATVRARAYTKAARSACHLGVIQVIDDSNYYTWDMPQEDERYERLIIDNGRGTGWTYENKILTFFVDDFSKIKGTHSWAKYEDYTKYDTADRYILQNADHNTGMNGAWITTVEKNTTNSHNCCNFDRAYYRYYYQSDTHPDPVVKNSTSSVKKAQRIHPNFKARVAYTVEVEDNTTGVDEIVDDNVAAEVDPDAPVFFYNLQGVMVDGNSLVPGNVYIRVQGTVATKLVAQ